MPDHRDTPAQDRRAPVERLVTKDLDEHDGLGKAFSRRALQTQRSVESYLRAGVRPRWMGRLVEIDHGIAGEKRRLERAQRFLREQCEGDAALFGEEWRALAASWRFDELNELIRQHNDWYPIERDLPMDPRTGEYVRINGKSYRRPTLGADWVLEQFPPEG